MIPNERQFVPDLSAQRLPPGQQQRTLYGGVMVTPTPLVFFGGDQVFGASVDQAIDITSNLGGRCTGFLITSVIGSVKVSVNGGGAMTVPTAMAVNDSQINSLRLITGVASSCILNLQGV